MRAGDAPKLLSADLTGARVLTLLVDDGGDTSNDDEVAWGGAMIELLQPDGARPAAYIPPAEELPRIAAPSTSPRPAIHGARVTGATPGRPFLFRVPATGAAPLRFSAEGLPAGLALDASTGIISGKIESAGESVVQLSVAGPAARRAASCASWPAKMRSRSRRRWAGIPGTSGARPWTPRRCCSRGVARSQRARGARLPVHRHRRRVVREARRGRADRQPNEKFPDMRALADCRARARPEAGHLFLAGTEDLRRTSQAAGSTRRRTPRPTPPGASIS